MGLFVVHSTQAAPKEIDGRRFGLAQTAPFILFAAAAGTEIIASNFRHTLLLSAGGPRLLNPRHKGRRTRTLQRPP
jgi:hypothetical protein